MAKAQKLYMKHLYSTGEEQDEDQKKPVEDLVINEISRKFESRYRDRKNDFRDSSNNRHNSYDTDQRRWQNQDGRKNFDKNSSKYYQPPVPTGTNDQITQARFDTMTNRQENTSEQVSHQRQKADRQPGPRADDSTHQQN